MTNKLTFNIYKSRDTLIKNIKVEFNLKYIDIVECFNIFFLIILKVFIFFISILYNLICEIVDFTI